jgi:large subunit ribosomal protein L25
LGRNNYHVEIALIFRETQVELANFFQILVARLEFINYFLETTMANEFIINADMRSDIGKGASRRLRRSAMVPAIIYGGNKQPTSISIEHLKFATALENEAFYTRILTIKIGDTEEKAVLRDLQRHAYRPQILHADFQRISATEKVNMRIPLHFKGGDVAPGVKLKGGIVSHLMSEIEIRCLPADLPEFIEIDLSNLDLDETLHLSDLTLPKGTEIQGLVKGSTNDKPVANVYTPRAAVEEAVAPTTAAVETVAEAKAKEKAAEDAKAEAAGIKGGEKK